MSKKFFNKKKSRWCCVSLTTLTLLFFSITTYAVPFTDFFSIPKDDYSLVLLRMIFGPMNGILKMKSTDLTIMGTIFKTFNSAMLCLAVIIITYTLVMSIINTAHQGEFLGKKYDSMWVPLRSIMGIIVIIPTHSGYSIIQLIIMWTVIQGVGAADHVWKAAYDFMSGNSGNNNNQIGNSWLGKPQVAMPNMTTFTTYNNNIKKTTVCMNAAYQEYGGATSVSDKPIALGQPFNNVIISSQTGSSNGNGNSQSSAETFDGYNFNCYYPSYIPDSEKGTAHLPDCTTFPQAATKSKYSQPPYYNPQNQDLSKQGAAPIQINCGIITWPSAGNTDAETKYGMTSELAGIYQKNIEKSFKTLNTYAQAFVFEGTPFPIGTKDPIPSLAAQFQQQIAKYEGTEGRKLTESSNWSEMPKKGWIMAGSYYYSIAQLSTVVGDIGNLASLNAEAGTGDSYDFAGQTTTVPGSQSTAAGQIFLEPLDGIVDAFSKVVAGATTTSGFINKNFNYSDTDKVVNPIVVIQLLGSRIIDIIEAAFEMGIIAVLAFAVVAGICPAANPITMVFSTISRFILVPIMFGLGLLLTIGLTMEVYIPLVPFIIFFFAAVGWLIGVIESVLAGPLIALGIAHPEGQHELFGRAEPALMLLVNVFVRPSFLIIGLIVAILLASAAVTLLNLTFQIILGATSAGLGASYGAVQSVLYLCIYVSLVIAIINKSFGLITTMTDAVLRFIGNQHQLGAEQGSGEQETKQAFGGAAGGGGQVHGAATNQASGQSEKGTGAWEHGGGLKSPGGHQDRQKKTPSGTAGKGGGGESGMGKGAGETEMKDMSDGGNTDIPENDNDNGGGE